MTTITQAEKNVETTQDRPWAYATIYVPVDNSEYSNRAIDVAVKLGAAYHSQMVGSHVYAATMHDYRFKQMEFTLPEEYLQEDEIERQRKIHDSLIKMGLELISDSYLAQMCSRCKEQSLEFLPKMMDGKHHAEIIKDIASANYDLVVLGALGIGKVKDSLIGSVCDRVTRVCAQQDIWVVKHIPEEGEVERDTILVGIDGSPQSFGGMLTAVDFAKRFGKKIELIGVYDPYLHYAVFNGIVDVLSEKAAKVFRFEEQNQLHEEVIDTGLAQIYQSHLNVAESMAREEGVEVTKTLLDGKAFQKILDHSRKLKPWLLVLGRIGVHSEKDETALGSNTENLLRLAGCDVLLSTRAAHPHLDLRAEESILWTDEAKERMKRVPEQVRGIARTGILRLAIEKGHSVITNVVIDEAMDRFMPKRAAQATMDLAETLAIEVAKRRLISMCKHCGHTAKEERPAKCPVCGSIDFEVISKEMIDRIAESEGGTEIETTYDGRKLKWSSEARQEVNGIADKYQRRRAIARIQKGARVKGYDTITLDFARNVIYDEVGVNPLTLVKKDNSPAFELKAENVSGLSTQSLDTDKKLIAVDAKGKQLLSVFDWTDEAVARILRVPAGFMRDKTQSRIEEVALDRKLVTVDLDTVEAGIELGRQMMAEMLAQAQAPRTDAIDRVSAAPDKCPVPHADLKPEGINIKKTESHVYNGTPQQPLNEEGVMSELDKLRRGSN